MVKIPILVKTGKTLGNEEELNGTRNSPPLRRTGEEKRGFFVRLRHLEVGRQTHTGIPWLLSNAPNGVQAPAPVLGQHTDAVMRDILGYPDAEIARLRDERVLS